MHGAGMHFLSECEAPVDEVASSEVVIVLNQRRVKPRHTRQATLFLMPELRVASLRVLGKPAPVASSGHRLPNNLLAPLRL